MQQLTLPATSQRVENATDDAIKAMRSRTDAELLRLERSSDEEISQRLAELDAEWDVERVLRANASVLAMAGVALGLGVSRWFLLLPTAVFSFLGQHALQGWCPPLPVLRRRGVRTQREIARERYALKALRGDFDAVPAADADTGDRIRAVLRAIDR